MRKVVALAVFVACGLFLSGCFPWDSDLDQPQLTATVISGTYTVRFAIINVEEPATVDWFFGDGAQELNSSELEIVHDYAAPGTYTVTAIMTTSSESPPGLGPSPGPALLKPLATGSETILTVTVTLPPIKPIEILDLTGEAIVPPPWWDPQEHGENEFPEGVPVRFEVEWRDNVPADDIGVDHWGWWAVQIETGRSVAYGTTSEAAWICPGDALVCLGGCGGSRETQYRIIVVMYRTDGRTERYEETVSIVPSL